MYLARWWVQEDARVPALRQLQAGGEEGCQVVEGQSPETQNRRVAACGGLGLGDAQTCVRPAGTITLSGRLRDTRGVVCDSAHLTSRKACICLCVTLFPAPFLSTKKS